MRDVTFGITSFERPFLLGNLVRSIQRRYPLAKIVVADNGRQKTALPDTVKRIDLPFDCGLSRARNALIDSLTTKYLLVLEDDFLFTDETAIEPLVEVLESDREVGVVGGAVRSLYGRVAAYALDIEVFRATMYVSEATHRVKVTSRGLPYRLCDMVWNFALFRKEMLADHRWDERLKVGEHCPYFHQVKLAARWRVAACSATRIYHVPEQRNKDYLKYRQRAEQFFQSYLAEQGIKQYQRVLPYHFEDDEQHKPCVIVLGVGHSGTTVLTRMLHALGWNAGDADTKFAESQSVRSLNQAIEKCGRLPRSRAQAILEDLPQPWAIKDPRFVKTLHHWIPLFLKTDRKPVLLRVRRDCQSLLRSYARRKAVGDLEQRIQEYLALSQMQYERWPWQRLSIEYELLAASVSKFDLKRYHAGSQDTGSQLPSQDSSTTSFLETLSDSLWPASNRQFLSNHEDGSLPPNDGAVQGEYSGDMDNDER